VHPTQAIEIFGNISAASIGHPLEMEMGAGMNLSGGMGTGTMCGYGNWRDLDS